jgi:hypothetical protein
MLTISPEIEALIDEELAKEATPPRPSTASWDSVSPETQALIDEELAKEPSPPKPSTASWGSVSPEAQFLIGKAYLECLNRRQAKDPKPLRIVPPLSPEKAKAWKEVRDIKRRVRAKKDLLCEHPAVRRPGCGQGGTFLIRKATAKGVKDAFLRPKCGRSNCPYCWRRRVFRTIDRAEGCLLFLPDGDVRTEAVWCKEIDWKDWPALNRKLRRKHGKECGRLHVRQVDDRCLVFCQFPMKGAEPLLPGPAIDRALSALDHLHTRRSSYRALGAWHSKKRSEWRRLAHFEQALDLHVMRKHLRQLGTYALFAFKDRPEIEDGLLWHSSTVAAADALWKRLEELCPDLALGERSSPWRKSATRKAGAWPSASATGWTAPGLSASDVKTPFD